MSTDSGHPDAEEASFDLVVRAVGTGISAEATLAVNVAPQEVNGGGVVDPAGAPISGVVVQVSGHASFVTEADGTFSVPDVAVRVRAYRYALGAHGAAAQIVAAGMASLPPPTTSPRSTRPCPVTATSGAPRASAWPRWAPG